ncbi:hypothetical protein [Deinococcus sp.]|uniref:hypothetical protein n=1 Tax=Deinococcus sp. TaxID=47478 RepID=UPI0028698C45|nr:hypothetical protein [Deinococcus sp.]
MRRRFWPTWTDADLAPLLEPVPDGLLSMARVQEYLPERRADGPAVRRDWATLTGHGCPTRLKLLAG